MILETLTEFCDATALNAGAAGQYLIGSQVDQKTVKAYPGNGDSLYFVAQVQTTCAGAGASLKISLASDAQVAIAVDVSATYNFTSATIPVASLVAGYRICAVEIPRGTYEQFLGVIQESVGAAFTAGKIDCFLTNDPNVNTITSALI